MRRLFIMMLITVIILTIIACKGSEDMDKIAKDNGCTEDNIDKETNIIKTITPEESTFFSTVYIEPHSSLNTVSDGDLWPAAWSDDDHLYTANGDGKGFDLHAEWSDIVMNKVTGHPSLKNIEGTRISAGDSIGQVWSDQKKYNKKPTGMLSIDGILYMAVQDLNKNPDGGIFDDAPAATILKSTDKGFSWMWDKTAPMFDEHKFTTIMFLDYGKDSENNKFDDYVYAYGMDYNWRASFSNSVLDPTELFLARMPKDSIQDTSKWQYFCGDLNGAQGWTQPGDIDSKKPVMKDERKVYERVINPGLNNLTVISQGSIVYNKPLDRYIYTSWTEFTFEFYEAPSPWGPWKRFLSKDFGVYPWSDDKQGGYGTVIPSKYISDDGREMWMNTNTFVGGIKNYNFSLRRLIVTPYTETKPKNKKSDENLALSENSQDVTPISKAGQKGDTGAGNDGNEQYSESSFNGEIKTEDFWGYTWSRAYKMNKLVYTTGKVSKGLGGWFDEFKVQVRQNFEWIDVSNISISPTYAYNEDVGSNKEYTFTFDETWGDGIRVIGKPGGGSAFTSVSELEVYYSKLK